VGSAHWIRGGTALFSRSVAKESGREIDSLPEVESSHSWHRIIGDAVKEGLRTFGGGENSDDRKGDSSDIDPASSKPASAGSDSEHLRRFLMLMWPERHMVGIAVSTIAVTSPVMLLLPRAIGAVLDSALAPDAGASAGMSPGVVVAGLAGLFAVQSALIGFRSGTLAVAGERISARLRIDAFKSLLRQDIAWFDKQSTGDLVNRLSSDATVVQKALTGQVAAGLRNGAMAVGATGMLIWLSPSLAAVSLAAIPPLAIVGRGFGKYMRGRQEQVQRRLGGTIKVAEGLASGVRTVRAFNGEGRELLRFRDAVGLALEQARRVGIAQAGFDAALVWSTNLALLAVLGYGGFLVQSGAMTAGDLTSFLMYSLYAGFNAAGLGSVWAEWQRGVGAGRRLFAVLDSTPTMPAGIDWAHSPPAMPAALTSIEASKGAATGASAPGVGEAGPSDGAIPSARMHVDSGGWYDPSPESVRGEVSFDDVTFAYPTRQDAPVLTGFSLQLEPGKTTALVGASGSGKSTAAALLTRMYDPQAGRVMVDGVDVRRWSVPALRGRAIGLVEQSPRLIAATVGDSIAYGRPGASEEEIRAAAASANALDFIEAFPMGFATSVGEGGQQLSGGQRARVALARVLLAAPPIVVLDEASAALDAQSEAAVAEAVTRVTQGRTVLTIAHRLSTIAAADSVAVLQQGRVAELGKYSELVADEASLLHQLLQPQLSRQ
jgi:ABC-type multidrug transport system fused ATPase/permease subunit